MFDGALIKQLREEKGLTQSELGTEIGTDGNVISRWERKRAIPSNDYLSRLADFFDKPIDFFMKGDRSNIKERSITENKGMLVFELGSQRLEVPATAEFSQSFWERVDKMIEISRMQATTA